MPIRRVECSRELHSGHGTSGQFLLCDVLDGLDALLKTHAGKIKLIYMDPPFLTGEKFYMRVRVGEAEWKSGHGTLRLPTFDDGGDRAAFLSFMREVLTRCRKLLSDDGMIFVHIDYRTHPHMRLLCDELFGEDNFLNEIIWAYRSGGRSLRYFSRKHDVILFYRKSDAYDFNVEEVREIPTEPRTNHMRRHVDPDGRVYRSIRSGDKVYTYYDDEPVTPSDVWTDLSHLQQKDPERTGYDAQKPLSLLMRIVKAASRAGEIVLDPFAGSCTTLDAAQRLGRDFIGIDRCPLTANIARRRLYGTNCALTLPASDAEADCGIRVSPGIGFYHVELERFGLPGASRSFEGLDAVDNWSVGCIRVDGYHVMSESLRTKRSPKLLTELNLPMFSGVLTACINDVYGRSFLYEIAPELLDI